MKNRGILWRVIGLVMVIGIGFLIYGQEKPLTLPLSDISPDLKLQFGRYYEPVKFQVQPNVPKYPLPLQSSQIQNYSKFSLYLNQGSAKDLLLKNGFVTISWGKNEDVVSAYKQIKQSDLPVFITSDSLLHLYHIQFDETLKRIEEKEFYSELIKISQAYQKEFQERYKTSSGITKEANRRGIAFFTVAMKLLDPKTKVPKEVESMVSWELKQIEAHKGFPGDLEAQQNSIFKYKEDYSQYVPRGHYTQSQNLKRYFKAMMWFGRMTMLIKGDKVYGTEPGKPALVSPEEAKIQTILASAIAGLAGELKVDEEPVIEKWNRIYGVTAYYVGFADDLSLYEYQSALRAVFGDKFKPSELALEQNFSKFKAQIASLRKPAIYSGTGESEVGPGEGIEGLLDKTQGLRFMGQRYVPDSYILGKLVLQPLTGNHCFTTVCTDYGCIRGFPRGLDVMAVFGSKRALKIMDSLGDSSAYAFPKNSHQDAFLKLKKQFDEVSEADWNQNLYWSWLYVLKGLIAEQNLAGYPTFMQTDAWKDKQLNSALGSWASLRHDTILYVKQSYTPTLETTAVKIEFPVVGYVEPAPEFYARLITLTRMTIKGLEELKALDEDSKARLSALDNVLTRLLNISIKELENKKLTEEDYYFIKNFAEQINAIVSGAGDATQKTTLIADVHTDQNSGQVLEEGTGYLRLMLVAYRLPEGHILIGAGPVYSYYEFKHPMSDRLTDEKWREMLNSGKAPSLPEWTKSFASF